MWELIYIQGAKVGHAWNKVSRAERDGRPVVRIEWRSRLVVQRFGERTNLETWLLSDETLDGRLIDFDSYVTMGPTPMQVRGRVDGDRLVLKTVSAEGEPRTTSIPWSDDDGGFYAVEASLLSDPIKPGQRRTLRALVPNFNQVATVDLVARSMETVDVPGGRRELLRVDNTMRLPGAPPIDGTMWLDADGEILKTRTTAIAQETYRASRAEALDETTLGQFDLGMESVVRLDRPLNHPHATRRARYRVRLAGGDPAGALVATASQQVTSIGPDTAEVTVYALRPGRRDDEPVVSDSPTPDDLAANSIIQSDDPTITAMAREMVGSEEDPWAKAVALERGVHQLVRKKNFSQALATASEVARSREGDCTEHAVLLAALARAVGLPARVAVGLVYTDKPPGFAFHMWTQVYLDERWIPLDATLGAGGIGAAHLELAHTNLTDAAGLSCFLPVVHVLGRLQIEVLETTPMSTDE